MDFNSIISQDCNNILTKSPCCWDLLRNKKLFITGGTGFLGKWLLLSFLYINMLLELNASMTVLSRSPEKFLSENQYFKNKKALNFIQGDIRDFIFPLQHFDFLIHAATPASAKLEIESPQEMYSIIVDGTEHILDFVKKSNVQRTLFTSSGAVYGIQPPEIVSVPENYPTNPVTTYGKGKLKAETAILSSEDNLVIARCFTFVGPYLPLNIHYAAGNFIRDGLLKDTIIVQGDGRPYRSYLYAADLTTWLWTILLNGKNKQIYNVGSEEPVSIAELAKIVSECFSKKIDIVISKKSNAIDPAPRYVPNTIKAQTELSLRQNYSLRTSIKRTIKWNTLIRRQG